jgi:glycosyltransferase involved in cell wall biosynthesis
MPRRFPERSADAGARPSVCIVTSELVGPFNNGGIGTSMTGLAQNLAGARFPLTILYTGGHLESEAERTRWRSLYAGIGITLVWLADLAAERSRGPLARCGFTTPWQIYRYLRDRTFDIVQFNDCMGEGFYCLAARRLGTAFRDTTMFVALHSPSQWIFEINRTLPHALLHAAFNHAERLSVKCADLLWGPSLYLIEWARDHGFEPPERTYVQRYVLPSVPLFGPAAAAPVPTDGSRIVPREIVFFGRLEERKGLRTFCQSLRLIENLLVEHGIRVTFLGKEGTVADRPALDYLAEEAKGWRFEHGVIANYGQQEAVAHLASGTAVAVMASPADNSPCTVYEAMSLGIPFIATRTGGIPELVDSRDHSEVLFEPRPEALAARVEQVIRNGIAPARAAEAPEEIARRWISAFESHRVLAAPVPPRSEKLPSVIAIVDAPAGTDIAGSLASLEGVEKILVIDRGGAPDLAAAPCPVVSVDAHRPDALAACLEDAGAEALLLLLRGGVCLTPSALCELGQLLECPEAEGLAPAAVIGGDGEGAVVPPLGSSQSFSFFEGPLPGGALFLKRARLSARVGRFVPVPDAEFLGLADLAIARGLEVWPFAETVVRHPAGLLGDPFRGRAAERVRAYSDLPPTERYYLSAIAHGCFERPPGPAQALRALRDRMIAWRLGWAIGLAQRTLPRGVIRRLRRRG